MEELVYNTTHSLIEQSRAARFTSHLTNADGFGVGWYGTADLPGMYRSVSPAWSDRNLQDLCAQIESPLFLAHVRATTGTPVQQTNCHPFRHGRWLWMHNGLIEGFGLVRRELLLAVDPKLFAAIEGTTDSELMFYLALTLGLDTDAPGAVARMVGFVEETCKRHGIEHAMQMSLATSDGRDLWVFRYSTERRSRSLYYSTDIKDLRKLYPDVAQFKAVSEKTRLVVSEPFVELPGAWNEVPEGSYGLVRDGDDTFSDFRPDAPRQSAGTHPRPAPNA